MEVVIELGAAPEDHAPSIDVPPDYDVDKGLDQLRGLNGDIKVAIEDLNTAVERHNEKRAEAEKLLREIIKAKKKQRIKCVRTSCACCLFNPHPPVLVPVCSGMLSFSIVRRC